MPPPGGGGDRRGEPVKTLTELVECFICAESCTALCVFACGHFTCYVCGLRIHSLNKGGCPVCREKGENAFITQVVSKSEEQYSQEELATLRQLAVYDRKLCCYIDGNDLAGEMAKLYEFLCPMESCWKRGEQDPFLAMGMLRDHLCIDHKQNYCGICLESRPAFLCEQITYSPEALQQHMEGRCPFDSHSFTGHPPCKFCRANKQQLRFYDGEVLLKHMQQSHFTCDVCNRGQFTFTFYDNRNKLNQHFEQSHKLCDHPDCASLDYMVRVFASEFDLAVHKQRVHGVKARLQFTPGELGVPDRAPGSSPSGGSGAPANASSTNAIQITFDHVFRKETVEMMPARPPPPRQGGRRGHRGGGGPPGGSAAVHVSDANGLPEHYMKNGVLHELYRDVDPNDTAGAASPVSRNGDGPTHAFGVAETMEHYNKKNKIPTDPQEQQRRLEEIVQREVRSPVDYAHFRGYTREFLDSKLLTSEYYDILVREFFPDPAVFMEVFPLLVATVPNSAKKSALQEVWKMKMAPETQRQARVRQEEEKARAEREEQDALWRAIKAESSRKGGSKISGGGAGGPRNAWGNPNAKKGPRNAWLSDGTTGTSPTSAAEAIRSTTSPPANSTATYAGNVRQWGPTSSPTARAPDHGIGSVSPPAPTPSPPPPAMSSPSRTVNYIDPHSEELFPSLPSNNPRRADPNKKKPQPKRPNAWFQR